MFVSDSPYASLSFPIVYYYLNFLRLSYEFSPDVLTFHPLDLLLVSYSAFSFSHQDVPVTMHFPYCAQFPIAFFKFPLRLLF